MSRPSKQSRRGYGIAEWYGESIVTMSPARRRELALIQQGGQSEPLPCPPRCHSGAVCHCSKNGGVCSIREYSVAPEGGGLTFGPVRTTCPYRFEEKGLIFRWIGGELLGTEEPLVLSQIPLLERTQDGVAEGDLWHFRKLLVDPETAPSLWCALEVQETSISGVDSIDGAVPPLRGGSDGMSIPHGCRAPKDRDAAFLHLLPHLQAKVPAIRRWGCRLAVVVDEVFYANVGPLWTVDDPSNGDVVWFCVGYEEGPGGLTLSPCAVHVTTLEDATSGLSAAVPIRRLGVETRMREQMRWPA